MSRSKLNKHNFPRNILSDPATHFLLGHFLYCCVVSKNHALSFGILGNWKLYIHPITHQITSSMKTGLVVVVQSPSRVQLFVTPWTAARQASLSLTISWSLPKLMSIEIGDAIQAAHSVSTASRVFLKFHHFYVSLKLMNHPLALVLPLNILLRLCHIDSSREG